MFLLLSSHDLMIFLKKKLRSSAHLFIFHISCSTSTAVPQQLIQDNSMGGICELIATKMYVWVEANKNHTLIIGCQIQHAKRILIWNQRLFLFCLEK